MTIQSDLSQSPSAQGQDARRAFPSGFVYGAATAAFQIEGANHEDGRTDSIWDAFARVPGAVVDGHDGSVACDHYHRYPADVALLKELGVNTYRFSTSWSRVRPDGGAVNAKGLDFYSRLVDELLAAGITPWPTLYHWDMPQALEEKGGWASRDTVDRFVEYALSVHERLGDRVSGWTTFNEPWCSSFLSYTAGAHAPGRKDPKAGVAAGHHLLLSHGRTVEALRAAAPEHRFGITLNLSVVKPARPDDAGDRDAARRIDAQFNRFFLDPVFRGVYADDLRADLAGHGLDEVEREGDLAAINQRIDFLGVNYYHGETVGTEPPATTLQQDAPTDRPIASPYPNHEGIHWHPQGLPVTNMGWEVQPDGLTELLERVHREYSGPAGIPLYVTENGASYDDELAADGRVHDAERTEFLRDHLGAVLDAREAGVDVRGYFYWSLMDNFEWAWGYHKRFGIVHVDYDTQVRTIKDSGLEYQAIIARQAL